MPAMEVCGRCRGEGECITERDGWTICPECGGDGYVDEYEEDEWHEDDDLSDDLGFQEPYSWALPEYRPPFIAVLRFWGVRYLPFWVWCIVWGFLSHHLPMVRRDDNIRDIPF